ncbi:MAG: hypothetical protein ACE366_24595 [Bradymonadia bacterium]
MVITPSAAVARWARQPIQMGHHNIVTPIVIGPSELPVVTDPDVAVANPEMLLMSVIAHGRGRHAVDIARAAAHTVSTLDEDKLKLYTDMALMRLNRAARRVFADMSIFKDYEPQSEMFSEVMANILEFRARLKAEAEAQVKAEVEAKAASAALTKARQTLKTQMRLKFQTLTEAHEAFIDTADIETLDRSLERILSAETAEAVLHG